jgi:DNA repair protein RecO
VTHNSRQPIQSSGIIVGTQAYSDSDLILRVVCQGEGKVSLLAKYARKSSKRFGVQLDIFDCGKVEAEAGRGSLMILKSFIPLQSFGALRDSLEKMTAASITCECFDFLLHEEAPEDHDAFEDLRRALTTIDGEKTARAIAAAAFQAVVGLLATSGFADPSEFEPRGTHAFEKALRRVEEVAERALRSKGHLSILLDQLKAPTPAL